MDAIGELFAWAEDNHYLQKTALMIKRASAEFAKIETELAEAKKRLAEAEELLTDAANGGELSPNGWVSLVLRISGFLSKNVGSFGSPAPTNHVLVRRDDLEKAVFYAGEAFEMKEDAYNRLKAALAQGQETP